VYIPGLDYDMRIYVQMSAPLFGKPMGSLNSLLGYAFIPSCLQNAERNCESVHFSGSIYSGPFVLITKSLSFKIDQIRPHRRMDASAYLNI
jgi:hypothetical protein